MEIGTVRQVDIGEEMEQAYLDYAMSVIVSRALPDVRDGLKPVQRRILYAMHDMGLAAEKPYKKSARIVGEVLGKYHPHSDSAVYDAMVRMAQDFSMLCPLVDGQGNFGSIDGDGAAAMRYTEARLQPVTSELLNDIGKDTVDFVPNFDGTLLEPVVLPSALPNLLVNGASGIAVGMATNIPPHNLGEVCDALIYLTDGRRDIENVTTEDLLQFVQGPDFPTGGIVYRYQDGKEDEPLDALEGAYAVGRGRFTIQAKAHVEEMTRSRHRIIVTELPYQVNKSRLVERIAELARDGRIEGITDLRDESDRQGLRVVIELSRTVDPRETLAALYKLTPMQQTFGMILLALVDGEPRLLSLKRALQLFLEHRREILTRRSRHDLEKAKLRAHILEGLLVALANLDEVIALIRRSRNADTARRGLCKRFSLTEAQAQAILDMQLRRLAALERKKIEDEYKEKKQQIAYLEDLLANPKKIVQVIRDELEELKRRYGTPRRTQIVQREKRDLTARDLVADRDVVVVASASGKLRQYPLETLPSLAKELDEEMAVAVAKAHTRDDLLICMENGDGYTLPLHRLPGGDRAGWASLSELCGAERTDRIAGLVCLSAGEDGAWPGFVTLVSRYGKVKRAVCEDLRGLRGSGVIIGLDEGDVVVDAFRTTGEQNILICTAQGQAIHFSEEEVRPMGLPAGGVLAIKLAAEDEIVGAMPALPDAQVAVATRAGYGKRTAISDFPVQKRYGAGVIAYKISPKTGAVAGAALVGGKEKLAALTSKRRLVPVSASSLPSMGRNAQGKVSVRLRKGEEVDDLVALYPEPVLTGRASARRTRASGEKTPAKSKRSPSRKAASSSKATKESKSAASRKGRTAAASKGERAPRKKSSAAKEAPDAAPKSATQKRKPASATPGKPLTKKRRPSSGAKTRKKGVVRSVKKPE